MIFLLKYRYYFYQILYFYQLILIVNAQMLTNIHFFYKSMVKDVDFKKVVKNPIIMLVVIFLEL